MIKIIAIQSNNLKTINPLTDTSLQLAIEAQKRGFKVFKKENVAILNLSKIQNIFEKNKDLSSNPIDLKILKDKKLINKKYFKLKILGSGELKTKVDITADYVSKQAQEKIEKIGGKLNLVKR